MLSDRVLSHSACDCTSYSDPAHRHNCSHCHSIHSHSISAERLQVLPPLSRLAFHFMIFLLNPVQLVQLKPGRCSRGPQPAAATIVKWQPKIGIQEYGSTRRILAPCFGWKQAYVKDSKSTRLPPGHTEESGLKSIRRAGRPWCRHQ